MAWVIDELHLNGICLYASDEGVICTPAVIPAGHLEQCVLGKNTKMVLYHWRDWKDEEDPEDTAKRIQTVKKEASRAAGDGQPVPEATTCTLSPNAEYVREQDRRQGRRGE